MPVMYKQKNVKVYFLVLMIATMITFGYCTSQALAAAKTPSRAGKSVEVQERALAFDPFTLTDRLSNRVGIGTSAVRDSSSRINIETTTIDSSSSRIRPAVSLIDVTTELNTINTPGRISAGSSVVVVNPSNEIDAGTSLIDLSPIEENIDTSSLGRFSNERSTETKTTDNSSIENNTSRTGDSSLVEVDAEIDAAKARTRPQIRLPYRPSLRSPYRPSF